MSVLGLQTVQGEQIRCEFLILSDDKNLVFETIDAGFHENDIVGEIFVLVFFRDLQQAIPSSVAKNFQSAFGIDSLGIRFFLACVFL